MTWSARDRALGMDRAISRRDFLNGTALAIGAATLGWPRGAAHAQAAPYPPAVMGLRGQHDGAFDVMHALRDGTFWENAGTPQATGEHYDLVVVGAGISGLAAAFLYRQQAGEGARILLLDNHDDFGGHATRQEFTTSDGRLVIGYGGSQSLETPSYFTPAVKQLLTDIGIDLEKFHEYFDSEWHERLGLADAAPTVYDSEAAVLFRKEDFGEDKLVIIGETAAEWVPNTPLNDKAKADLIELFDSPRDYLAGKTREEKLEILANTTYEKFLTDICGYDPQLVTFFQCTTQEYFGAGIDAVNCLDAWANGNPGFDAMDLGEDTPAALNPSGRILFSYPDEYIFHFPDGNAGVARALVRKLIPEALPGSTMEDLVTARADYSKLDQPAAPVRIRLSASVVRVKHQGAVDTAESVEVAYVEGGALKSVTANHVVLACWHRVIPLITDEIPPAQVEALQDQVKVPLIYANVLLRNFEPFAKLGVDGFEAPGHFWSAAKLDYPVSIGDYKFAQSPSEPVLLHLWKVMCDGSGASVREQSIAGRYLLTTLTFEDMERELRDLLARGLAGTGFDPATDIEAITINRWSHGYACEYARPWDGFWPDGPLPIEAARKGWGRIAIANSDSGAYAYANSAIDQAARAVRELLGDSANLPAYATFPGPPLDAIGLE